MSELEQVPGTVLSRKQESMAPTMFGFPSNIFSTSSTSGYPIFKDIRGFILLKLDMYNKITEFFSSVSYNQIIPVSTVLGYRSIQCGSIKPTSREVPMMAEFRVDERSTDWRLERTTPLNIPNMMMRAPPSTGWGMVMNTAENLPIIPNRM